MAAINPTDVSALIVDEFIQHATTHLTTISGIVSTLSLYPPLPSPAPGIVNWTGYIVAPATYTKAEIMDRVILNEIIAKPDDGSVELETDPEINKQFNEKKGDVEGYRVDPDAGGFGEAVSDLVAANVIVPAILPASLVYSDLFVNGSSNLINPNPAASVGTLEGGTLTPNPNGLLDGGDYFEFDLDGDGVLTKFPETPVFPPPPPPAPEQGEIYPGGETVSFGKLSVVTGGKPITIGNDGLGLTREQYLIKLKFADGLKIANVDMSKDWITIGRQYLVKKEGFTSKATNDEGDPRLGYGTSQILDIGATQTRLVKYGDVTTQEQAAKVLELEVRTTYKNKVVGNKATQITEADWNALNDRQRAALVSFVYNCGSFTYYPNIPNAIKSKNYIAAATGILNGPIGGAESGNVYSGLVRRRAEEAGMFAFGL